MKTPTVKIHVSLQIRRLLFLAALVFSTCLASANTELWTGVSGTSVTTNWSDNANWNNITGGGGPGPNGNDVIFGDSDPIGSAGIVNSVVDNNSLNPFSLTFTNNSANGFYHTVLIPAGIGMTNANALTVGIRLSTANSYVTTVGFVGAGTLVQNGNLQVDNSTTVGGSGLLPTLDLSGLTNFIFTNATGTITVAGTSSGSEARGSGRLNLAGGTNTITVGTINVALGTGNGGLGGTIYLGTGTNILNVGTINLAAGKINNATMKFLDVTGGLRIRGVTGADDDRNVTMTLGNRSNSGSGTPTGVLDFTGGHPIDVKVNTVNEGRSNQTGDGAAGIFMDAGTFDATTINMAIASNTGAVRSTNLVNGGFLIVSNLSMANQTSTGVGTGNLIINSPGTVIISNSIVKTTVAGVANILMTGGSLKVGSNIGVATNLIDNLSVSDSSLTLPAKLTASAMVNTLTASGTANTLNITSVPTFFTYPAQFPVISYVVNGGNNDTFVAGTIAGGFQGYASNNLSTSTIDIVITNGPALAQLKSIRWNGTPTGDWNTTALNWLTNSTAVNYNQGDTVTFNDTLTGTTNVNLTQTVIPSDFIVNNSASNYLFTGTGKISGATGLTKNGNGTLIIDNSGVNDFVGPVAINAGTVQVGNNDTNGNLPSTAVTWDDAGTLAFSRSDNLVISTIIQGSGSLVQRGNGKLSLNAADTYSGNTVITKGTLALTAAGSIANSPAVYAQGGAFDISAAAQSMSFNTVGLSNGTFIVSTNFGVTVNNLSLTNSTISLVADAFTPNINVSGSLTTAGTANNINVTEVRNVPDGSAIPAIIPLITYSSSTFAGGFNVSGTNFPNSYISNDVANSRIVLVLTAQPYSVIWNGGSSTGNNWSDSNNWSGVGIFANDSLTFDGTTRLNPLNDTAAGTTYSNVTFNGGAGAFTLSGNPITLSGGVINNSANTQTINLGLNFSNNASLNGTAAPLIIAGGLTNTSVGSASRVLTLTGTGILTNLLGSIAGGGTNQFLVNDGAANWTLMDNPSSTTISVPWAFTINNGTFNFGSASSAPKLISTSPQGVPQDDQVGGNGGNGTLNISNGLFTTSARLNTGGNTSSGTINQYGGVMNIANQFQGANGSAGSTSAVNLYGGIMNIGVSPTVTNFGTFFVASRGPSTLTITNSALLNVGTLDVSRSINAGISGTVNLDGGTIVANNVATATANQSGTGSTATFYFNGGVLKARTSTATFFQGRTTAPVTPITAYVTARGAIIDSDTNAITFLEPLLTDPNLGGAPDGGLKKLGTGTLTMVGTNTFVGKTLVGAGTLIVNGEQVSSAVVVSNNATLGGNGVVSNVTVNAGGTLSPGTNGIGTLTVSGNVSLAGTTTMEVDKAASTNDVLLATNTTPTTITYGGTLNVVPVNGSLAPGDTFKLFSADNYAGSFTVINPPGVTWNTSSLNVNGTLTVTSIAPAGPTTNASITKVTLSGTNLLVHGTNNNVPNNTLHYVVLTSTNLATPLSNWTPVVTNTYNADGTFDYLSPIVPGTPRQFIEIKAAP
jgi:fibronectin-binding autotransporter adhesin